MEIQDAYKQKMAAQLKEWSAQIDLLEAKMENAGADMKVKRAKELHELRAKQRMASEKMKELEQASGEAWERIKGTVDKIWDDLKTGVAEAHSKFK
ncbi:MAG: sll1863 family stress response protein [Halothiobacillus sp.]